MSSSKSLLCGSSVGAWLLVAAFGCSGNTSLGGGADAGVGGTGVGGTIGLGGILGVGGSQAGGAPATGGKLGTSVDCNLIECFRAYECVEYCGGPIVSSGCCACDNGTIDQVTACRGTGGNTSTGSTASNTLPASGGTAGTGGSSNCGECIRPFECVTSCTGPVLYSGCCACAQGTVDRAALKCASTTGGSSGMGGAQATGGVNATGGSSNTYLPCAGKKCGETCTLCPPASVDCAETAVMKSCNSAGQCLAGNQQCTTPASGGSAGIGGSAATGGNVSSGGGSTTGAKCGAAVCSASEECCNASCSLCVPKGGGCIAMVCSTGGSTSLGGASGAGGATSIPGIHGTCTNGTCPAGLTPVEFYGIAGTAGPLFCSCEIPCPNDTCPTGMRCQYVADGPGPVCY